MDAPTCFNFGSVALRRCISLNDVQFNRESDINIFRFLLIVLGVAFALVGMMGVCAAPLLFGSVELTVTAVSAKAELRAAYGGLFLAMSFGAFRSLRHPVAKLMLSSLQWRLVLFRSRIVSLVLDGVPNTFSTVMHLLEFSGFVLTVIALRARSIRTKGGGGTG